LDFISIENRKISFAKITANKAHPCLHIPLSTATMAALVVAVSPLLQATTHSLKTAAVAAAVAAAMRRPVPSVATTMVAAMHLSETKPHRRRGKVAHYV
jgi:hypothetical protein